MAVPTLQEQIAAVRAAEVASLPTASAGQVAQDDGSAGIQNPNLATSTLATDTNGRIIPASQVNQDLTGTINSSYVSTNGTGTGDTLTTTNSQATPATSSVVTAAQANQTVESGIANPTTNAGVGAASDDNTSPSRNTTQQVINSTFNVKITPQANVLDQYSSYTYSISWYMLTPNQFKALSNSRNTAGWQLLMQSGGAPTSAPTATNAGRNQYFNLDYYLDNLTIHSKAMKGTTLAHNATDISFTVLEPNGITLIENLYKAVSNLWKQNPTQYSSNSAPNYLSNPYCLVIRFYGYDENGNLVKIGKNSSTGVNAVVEKYYPFLLTDLTFRVANKAIEYAIKAKPLPYFLNLSQTRGTIPFNYELVGSTVDDVLNGKAVAGTVPTDPGRVTSTQPQTSTAPTVAPAPTNNQVNTLPTPTNASNAYVDSSGIDFSQLSS